MLEQAKFIPRQIAREMRQDTRHALRLWSKRPWHAAFAIAVLAIGIGASTGVFSVVNTLLLRSLPFRDPGRLVALRAFQPPHDSAEQFHEWRGDSTYLADTALFEQMEANLGAESRVARARVAQTSWNFFELLGTQPVIGRAFTPGEDTPGRNAVAVIAYGLWQQLFAGHPRALGSAIRINGTPLTIVGVAPAGFDYPKGAVVWKAAQFSQGNNGWETIARLKPAVTWPGARQAFLVEAERLWPNPHKIGPPHAMVSLRDELAGPAKNGSLILMAAVVLILLIACTNVANLLMARTADRAPELSIRSALGASRARLAQQLLTECLLLSLAAAAAGIGVAFWTTSIAVKVQPTPLATQSYSVLDVRVLAFAILVSIASGLLFGILPALYAGRISAAQNRTFTATRGPRILRETLVAVQVMLTIILLTASVSVGRALVHLMRLDRGFNVKGVVTVSVALDGTPRQPSERRLPYFEETLARVRQIPGVRTASATEFLPLYATDGIGGPLGLDGRPPKHNSTVIPVLSDYFETMGGHVLYGREFTDAEVRSATRVAIVNEVFARWFGEPRDALGHSLTIGNRPPWTIIGVVKGMEYTGDLGTNWSQVFLPSHDPGGFFSTFVARVDGPAEECLAAIRDAIRSVDARVPVFGVKTMEQRLDDALARPRFYSTAVRFFAGFALLVALIGIYGIAAYAATQRTHEMGIRMALGTTPVRLRGVLLRRGLIAIGIGAIPGIIGALLCGRLLQSLVESTRAIDPSAPVVAVLLIALTASASIWAATRRIARLDIMAILRTE